LAAYSENNCFDEALTIVYEVLFGGRLYRFVQIGLTASGHGNFFQSSFHDERKIIVACSPFDRFFQKMAAHQAGFSFLSTIHRLPKWGRIIKRVAR